MRRAATSIVLAVSLASAWGWTAAQRAPRPALEQFQTPRHTPSAYVRFAGVEGDSRDAAHEGWSDLVSLTLAIAPGSEGGPLGEIVLVKRPDRAGAALAAAALDGRVIEEARVHLARAHGDKGNVVYVSYELKRVRVTSYGISNADPALRGAPLETIGIRAEELHAIHTRLDRSGTALGTSEYRWKVGRSR